MEFIYCSFILFILKIDLQHYIPLLSVLCRLHTNKWVVYEGGEGLNENYQRMFFILKDNVYLSQSSLVMDKYGLAKCLDGPLKTFTNFLDYFFLSPF